MHPVSSPSGFSLNKTRSHVITEQAASAAAHAIVLPQSAPRPVMQQSRSADPVSTQPLSHRYLSEQFPSGRVTPISLHSATTQGQLGLMRHLIKSGASVNALDTYGYTPLMEAAKTGQSEAAALLLKKGADPAIANSYGTQALHIAAYKGQSKIVERLIQSGQSVNQTDYFGNTPLIDALKSQDVATIKALVSAGANPNGAAQQGLTALMLGVAHGDMALLDLLLQNPQLNNIDAVDADGRTALNLTIRNGNLAATERLLKAGATIDHTCWPLISGAVIADLIVHRQRLFQPDFTAEPPPDNALYTAPIACIKNMAVLLSGSGPRQQAVLNKALQGLGLSGLIVEVILRMATHASALAPVLVGESNKPTSVQWSALCVSMMHIALSDPALQTVFNHRGLSPVTAERMNAIVRGQINALQAAVQLTGRDMVDSFKSAFITACLHLTLKDGGFKGPPIYTCLINQGLHHELAVLLTQIAVTAWDRIKKMDKPIHVGYVLPASFLGRAMDAMRQLLENEIRTLLQVEFSQVDHTYN